MLCLLLVGHRTVFDDLLGGGDVDEISEINRARSGGDSIDIDSGSGGGGDYRQAIKKRAQVAVRTATDSSEPFETPPPSPPESPDVRPRLSSTEDVVPTELPAPPPTPPNSCKGSKFARRRSSSASTHQEPKPSVAKSHQQSVSGAGITRVSEIGVSQSSSDRPNGVVMIGSMERPISLENIVRKGSFDEGKKGFFGNVRSSFMRRGSSQASHASLFGDRGRSEEAWRGVEAFAEAAEAQQQPLRCLHVGRDDPDAPLMRTFVFSHR